MLNLHVYQIILLIDISKLIQALNAINPLFVSQESRYISSTQVQYCTQNYAIFLLNLK